MARPRKESKEKSSRTELPSDQYVSQFYIDPVNLDNENYHYRWVETLCNNAETQTLGTALRGGYEPVSLADLPEFAKTAQLMADIRGRGAKDEYVRTGDQILMRCPRAIYEQVRKAERRESKNQMSNSKLYELAKSINNAPTFVAENEYSRTHELSKAATKAFADDDD